MSKLFGGLFIWLFIGGLLTGGVVGSVARECPGRVEMNEMALSIMVLWPGYLGAAVTVGELPEKDKACREAKPR